MALPRNITYVNSIVNTLNLNRCTDFDHVDECKVASLDNCMIIWIAVGRNRQLKQVSHN